MPIETNRLKLPLPLGNEGISRVGINSIFEKIDEGVATREDLEELRQLVSEIDVPDASLTQKGIVQLSNAIGSTSDTVAATPKAINDARMAAVSAGQTYVDGKSWQKYRLTQDNGLTSFAGTTNVNSLLLEGTYVVFRTAPNAPSTSDDWYITVHSYDASTYAKQVATPFSGNGYYQRTFNGTAWGAWSQDLFTSVSNGKTAVAAAITGKGVAASGSDTFAQLSTKINTIETGKKYASGTSAVGTDGYFSITGLAFYPRDIVFEMASVVGRGYARTWSNTVPSGSSYSSGLYLGGNSSATGSFQGVSSATGASSLYTGWTGAARSVNWFAYGY